MCYIALCSDIQYFPNKRKAPIDCSKIEAKLETIFVRVWHTDLDLVL